MSHTSLAEAIYVTGDVAEVEKFLQQINVNDTYESYDSHDYDIPATDSFLTLALITPHHSNVNVVVETLIKHGAKVHHHHLHRSLPYDDVCKTLVTNSGVQVTSQHVIQAFRQSSVQLLQFFYSVGVRLSQRERPLLQKAIEDRCRSLRGPLSMLMEKFTRKLRPV